METDRRDSTALPSIDILNSRRRLLGAGNAAAILVRSYSYCVAAEQTGCQPIPAQIGGPSQAGPLQKKCHTCIIATCMTFSAKKKPAWKSLLYSVSYDEFNALHIHCTSRTDESGAVDLFKMAAPRLVGASRQQQSMRRLLCYMSMLHSAERLLLFVGFSARKQPSGRCLFGHMGGVSGFWEGISDLPNAVQPNSGELRSHLTVEAANQFRALLLPELWAHSRGAFPLRAGREGDSARMGKSRLHFII